MYSFRRILTIGLPLLVSSAAQGQADTWWRDVTRLAHDSMRGRNTGSPEHRLAARYIANEFKVAGLAPGATGSYLQPVRFISRTLDESKSSLTLVRDGVNVRLILGEDATFSMRSPQAARADAPVVFAGYGLSLPEYGVDDLAGLDIKGKVVAFLTQLPKGVPGPVVSHSRAQAWETFRKRGAVGVITFSGIGPNAKTAWERNASNRLTPALALADPSLDAQRGTQLAITVNGLKAEDLLFTGAPERFAALMVRADSGLALPHFALNVRIRSTAQLITKPVVSDNVVGVLRGSDPRLRNEYVVLTAHLDHVGVGRAVNGDTIYNGAMDNASGSAMLMDMARTLAPKRSQLKRSVIFLAVTAEEKGLLGSRYYANHPTVPPGSIVADLNTDMFLPIIPFTKLMVNGLEESDLSENARQAGKEHGIEVISDPEPEENRFIRSDQYSFILRGIPALSFKVGFALGTPEHKAVLEFRSKRYHFPSDDLEQPVDRLAAEGFKSVYARIVELVANRASRPSWNSDSYFRRLAPSRMASER